MAGHSKWANIKHRKARQDAKRGKAWSKCARAIIMAAKSGGGDPATNLTLRYAIDEAKAENMPKDTIQNAIKKGTGELEGVNYESVLYEGYGPAGAAVMLDIFTDNRNRTAGEIRKLFERGGGNLGSSGCVAYLFQLKGEIYVARENLDENRVMEAALEAGAEDVAEEDDAWRVTCEPASFLTIRQALEKAGLPIRSAELSQVPSTTVTVAGDDARKLLALLENLEDHEDVQKVYANFDIPEEAMAALEP